MENKEIVVSISCITYNHEPYIRECLEGFLMQKCNFGFEVLIHDDASTDGTADIIREYQEKYPEIIKPILQSENQWSKGVRMIGTTFNVPRAQGKYIALCEGDDYWTDPLKLQKQVDFLEANPEYNLICGGFISKVTTTGEEKIELKDVEKSEDNTEKGFDITLERFFSQWITKTLTLMFRKSAYNFDDTKKYKFSRDVHLNYELLKSGKGYYMKEIFGVYRIHSGGVFSEKSEREKYLIGANVYKDLFRNNKSDKLLMKTYYRFINHPDKENYQIKNLWKIYLEMFLISKSLKDFKKLIKSILF